VQQCVVRDNASLIVTSVLHPVFYNLFYKTWSRICIKWIGSKVANSFYFWNQFRILVHSNLQKPSPKSGKSQNLPLRGDFARAEYHWYKACTREVVPGKSKPFSKLTAFNGNPPAISMDDRGRGKIDARYVRCQNDCAHRPCLRCDFVL